MLDITQAKQSQHAYYAGLPTDCAWLLNGFTGTFAYEDPALVPELFRNLAVEYWGLEKYRRVDLTKLNTLLNELWEGPGSCAKISDVIWDIRIARRLDPLAVRKDVFKGHETPTIDDYVAVVIEEGTKSA